MRPALVAIFTVLLLAPAAAAEAAGADRPRVALSVSPARLTFAAPGSRTIKLRNDGAERIVVDATRRTLDGKTAAKTWLGIVPVRSLLRSGESATLTLRVTPPRRAEPGDHRVLVLLTTRPLRGGPVNVQVRLAVRITMVMPGRIVRRVTLGGVRVHRRHDARLIFVSVVNRGNVTVQLRGRVTALLVWRRRQLARLSPRVQRVLLPGGRAALAFHYSGLMHGLVIVVVQVRLASGIRVVERRYRIRI